MPAVKSFHRKYPHISIGAAVGIYKTAVLLIDQFGAVIGSNL